MALLFRMALNGVRHVEPVPPDRAKGLLAEVYKQAQRDFALVPPLTLHSACPEVAAGAWGILRESMLHGIVPRTYKEAIASAVSKANDCSYCIDAHTMVLHAAASHDAAAVIAESYGRIRDERLRRIVEWSLATAQPSSSVIRRPPFSAREAPEIIGTAVTFHYVNRLVNIFVDRALMPRWGPLAGWASRAVAWFEKGALHLDRRIVPGDSHRLLPEAPLPDDLGWARSDSSMADAFSRFVGVTEKAAREVLPASARAAVEKALAGWRGEAVGLGQAWIEAHLERVEVNARPAARLALLTAFASHQVDNQTIREFRMWMPPDAALVVVTSWAALRAARRIGTWLGDTLSRGNESVLDVSPPSPAGDEHGENVKRARL